MAALAAGVRRLLLVDVAPKLVEEDLNQVEPVLFGGPQQRLPLVGSGRAAPVEHCPLGLAAHAGGDAFGEDMRVELGAHEAQLDGLQNKVVEIQKKAQAAAAGSAGKDDE